MPIYHDQQTQQFIFNTEDGIQAGKLRYRYVNEQKIDVFSTRVEEAFQGKGIAGGLYNALIAFAEQQQLKIKPSCSYIEKRMARSHSHLIG